MFSSRSTVRYEERGQGYSDFEKVGKHCFREYPVATLNTLSLPSSPTTVFITGLWRKLR